MTLDEILPYLVAEVPGCPDVAIKRAILGGAAEFFRSTRAWNEVQDSFALIDGEPSYDVDVPPGATIVSVMKVWTPSSVLVPKTIDEIAMIDPAWSTSTASCPRYYNSAISQDAIRVYPTPANSNGLRLTIRAAYAPSLSATTIPTALFEQFQDALTSAALKRLMVQPGRTWSNPELAGYHKTVFDTAVIDARIADLTDRVDGSLFAKPVRFG